MRRLIIIGLVIASVGSLSFANGGERAVRAAKEILVPGDLEEGIEFFHGTWDEAKKKAKKEDKLIFLDAMATWCGPCKMMAKNTFTDKEVGAYFNKNFINVKMDMEKDPEGPRLSKKFGLKAYPSLYFLDENEAVVHSTIGYQDSKSLIALGEEALK